ncbi:uncharacterized protein METZ01_LOCUS205131, partial [marine metagenome]
MAKSHANLPCSELQILTPNALPFSNELWLGKFLSIHIKIKGG